MRNHNKIRIKTLSFQYLVLWIVLIIIKSSYVYKELNENLENKTVQEIFLQATPLNQPKQSWICGHLYRVYRTLANITN